MSKRALILGVGGQDGSYLAEVLLERGYEVHGLYRRSSVDNLVRIHHILDRITLHRGDLTDYWSLRAAIRDAMPDEIYNEADQDDLRWSFKTPEYSRSVTYEGVVNLLDVVSSSYKNLSKVRIFQPLSATMFGNAPPPQNEETELDPRSPYALYKTYAKRLCAAYRENGMRIVTGILYNHDSPRRGPGYLLQRIAREAINVFLGRADAVSLGNLDGIVDIGYAREFMQTAADLVSVGASGDYVIATGVGCRVEDVAKEALKFLGKSTSRVVEDPSYSDRSDEQLVGDTIKLRNLLPDSVPKMTSRETVREILKEML